MSVYDELLKDVEIPVFYKVRQRLDHVRIPDVAAETRACLRGVHVLEQIKPGSSVAVTAGSREIANYAVILKILCEELKAAGARPFIIPAMGSHGGAVAENQTALLAHFGITQEAMAVPVKSSMETVCLGATPGGVPVYFDKFASEADGIIPVGRIKIHTCFRGEIESGVMKMLAVGCGKQKGAAALHARGFENMSKNVTEAARAAINKLPILFGVGITENAVHQTRGIHVMPAREIEAQEKKILEESRQNAPKIPFPKVDVLIVNEMGKNISGTGMDPNITGRSSPLGTFAPYVERLAVLDLTAASEGSAYGVGNADVITRRLFDKIIMENTYPNGITNRDGKPMMIPPVMPDDGTAVRFALGTLSGEAAERKPRVVWLQNTLCMEEFYISESLCQEAARAEGIVDMEGPCKAVFDRGDKVIFVPL